LSEKRTRIIVSSLIISLILISYSLSSLFYVDQDLPEDGLNLGLEVHVTMRHWRAGILLSTSHHPGTLTNLGANWIEDQLGDSPSTDPAKWIAVSNSTDSPSSAWTVLPAEITTGGLGRSAGSYTDDGTGAWNISYTFSITGSNDARLAGLYFNASGNSLLCADTFTPVSVQNGDSLEMIWSCNVTGAS